MLLLNEVMIGWTCNMIEQTRDLASVSVEKSLEFMQSEDWRRHRRLVVL
jgi:hypothetical protein